MRFHIARLRRDETALQKLSTPVAPLLAGKSVALVGNARSLSQSTYGAQIDDADLVIRINSAPIPDPHSHGNRTDWIAMSTPPARDLIAGRAPSRLLWMTRKRKRLPYWLAHDSRFFLNPAEAVARLREDMGSAPTTGAMMIDLLLRSEAASIDLYGFDFFSSLSLSGRRTAEQVPHDFNAEQQWVERQMSLDPRLILHRV
nr:glycosyltransferase family 29 protein [Thalassovita aquimarina]